MDDAREKKRKWENMWSRTKLEIHRQLYVTARDDYTTIISAKKTEYYRGQLQNTNNKNMFLILRSLDVHQMQLPEFCSMKEGCYTLSRFFQDKFDKLLTNLHCHTAVDPAADETPCFTDSIHVFEPTTMAEITTISGTTDKTCTLDHLPTKQLNDNMESVVPFITYITNASLERMQLCLWRLSKQLSGHC